MFGTNSTRRRAKKGDGSEASAFRRIITMLAGLALIAGSFALFAAPAKATGDVDNKDCPTGYFFIAKAELNDAGVYEFEDGNANGVTITGDGDGGSFTSVTPVRALVIKGSTDREYIYYPPPGATSGDFTNDGLVTPSDQEPQISHVTFCGKDDPAQPDDKVEYSEWVDGNKDCESKTVTQTRTKSVTTYEWDGTKWVAQTPVVTTETRTRPMTEAELKECAGDQPDDKVTYSEWVEGEPNCESKTVTKTRTKTVTPYKWDGSKWVLDTDNAVTTTETETRPLTEEELKVCAGDQPDDKVEYSEWVDGNKDCESKTVTQTRTKSVTTYEWDGTKWVAQTPVVTTETRTRPMTEAELKECEPPVVVPPTCPNGTPWTDTNGNGMMDECNPPVVVPPVVTPPVPPVVTPPEVTPPKMIKPRVKKLDKCELNNFLWIKKHKGYKAFDAKTGKRLPEGRYFKVGKKVIKVKFVALKGFELRGKKVVKVVFPNMQSCSPDVVTPPPTGMRLTAS